MNKNKVKKIIKDRLTLTYQTWTQLAYEHFVDYEVSSVNTILNDGTKQGQTANNSAGEQKYRNHSIRDRKQDSKERMNTWDNIRFSRIWCTNLHFRVRPKQHTDIIVDTNSCIFISIFEL